MPSACYNANAISKGSRMAQYRQICVLRPSQINVLIKTRGPGVPPTAQHNILITVPSSKSMRAAISYVVSFPTGAGETRISIAGGAQSRWRGDGKELFFLGADSKMMTVAVKAGLPSGPGKKASFDSGVPRPLFEAHLPVPGRTTVFEYDVAADGERFLLDAQGGGSASAPPLTVVVNWDAGVKK